MTELNSFGLLSLIVFLPLLGAILISLIPATQTTNIRYAALGTSIATFAASLLMFSRFRSDTFHFQMVEAMPWVRNLGIQYKLGVDGISVWLILLSTFLMVICVWFSFYVKDRVKPYMIFMLMLETAMLGVFLSLDMILFYTFFEASLIPMYFLINIWGGARRAYASLKFFIYTFTGSIFMLIGILTLYSLSRKHTGGTFDIVEIQALVANGKLWAGAIQAQALIFWAFAIAFMVKCPMFPFHTWLPDAHVEAPTAGSVILAGVLLKMGTYGFLRFCLPLFPDVIQRQVPYIIGLAVIGIIYGAVVAAVQPDVKKLVAYSSVSHMGFVMLGIFSLTHTGMMGGAVQQLNHGISTGGLFLLIGLIYERTHTRQFSDYGGLKAQMPVFATLFLIMMLSSVGLPATNGFIGEFMALMGAFQSGYHGKFGINTAMVAIAGVGVILAAVYLLIMYMRMFYGPNANPDNKRLKDLKPWEVAMVGTLIVFVFWGGLFPNTFLKPMETSIGAARLMAISPVDSRPSWGLKTQEIDPKGNLVEVQRDDSFGIARVIRQVTPANFYFESDDAPMVAATQATGVALKVTGLERLTALATGSLSDQSPVVAHVSAYTPEVDGVIVSLADVKTAKSKLEGKAIYAEVLSPFGRALAHKLNLSEQLATDPIAGEAALKNLGAEAEEEIDQAGRDGADGIIYRLVGATPDFSTPMEYGGHYLEVDRQLLDHASGMLLNIIFIAGDSEIYLDFVSDLPGLALAWNVEATDLTPAQVRELRGGPIATNGDDTDLILKLAQPAQVNA